MSSTPPKGTAQRRRQAPSSMKETPRKVCTEQDLDKLEDMLSDKFEWEHSPRPFQLEAIKAQLKGLDVLVHAGTGQGKTAIAAGPHAHPSAKGKVTLMVSPLIALHDEMVETFQNEYKLNATAVNSSNGGCSPDKLQKITVGEWQIVMISPELLLTRRFISNVLKNCEFKSRVMSVFVDEAHVISHWGAGFRKKYGELGIIRSFLPKSASIVAVSATLSSRVRRDVLRVLRYHHQNYVNIDVGNDRPNVSIVVRAIHHPLNSYVDLDFILKDLVNDPTQIPKTFIYCDNIAMGTEIIDHLMKLLPEDLRHNGLIRPYNACFSKTYRKVVMRKFKGGEIRILVCTDAAGMGCNVPDIDLVVQWKLPSSVSSFIQRAGRAARAAGHTGLAVLLAEPSAYTTMLDEHGAKVVGGKKGKKNLHERANTKARKDYGVARGILRGSTDSQHDAILVKDCSAIDQESADEGLYTFVQSGTCRRWILTRIYQNKPAHPVVPCCDICAPSLLDRTRPGLFEKPRRKQGLKTGEPCMETVDKLNEWRQTVKERDFTSTMVTPAAILSDGLIEKIASVGSITTRQHLSAILAQDWGLESTYGDEFFAFLASINPPPLVSINTKTQTMAAKRKQDEEALNGGEQRCENGGKGSKKQRLTYETPSSQQALRPTESLQISFQLTNYMHSRSLEAMTTTQTRDLWTSSSSAAPTSFQSLRDEAALLDNDGVD